MLSALNIFLCFIMDTAVYILPVTRRPAESVLVIRMDAIGDFFLWLDSLSAYRQIYPRGKFRVLLAANAVWAELAGSTGVFDEIIPIDRRKFKNNPVYRLKMLASLRRRGFQVVINPAYSREFLFQDEIVRVSGAPSRIGFDGDTSNCNKLLKHIGDKFYNRLIRSGDPREMELSRNADFVRGLGLERFTSSVQKFHAAAAKGPGNSYWVMFPGAGLAGRRWGAARFSQLAELACKRTGLMAVICGDKGDSQIAQEIIAGGKGAYLDLTGKTSLAELAGIIAGAQFVVTNETSAVHIAASVGVPSVCISGGGHFGRFLPYVVENNHSASCLPSVVFKEMPCFGCNWRCIHNTVEGEPFPCVAGVAVEAVWDRLLEILDSRVSVKS